MFRPWGMLDWALQLSAPRKKWQVMGCLGPEERSTVVPLALHARGVAVKPTLLQIEEQNPQYRTVAAKLLLQRQQECYKSGLNPLVIPLDLFASITTIEQECPEPTEPSVVLDITSFPKRFFFYLLKQYFRSPLVRDLLVTYVPPADYPSAPLTADHDPWDVLPTFRPSDPEKERIANMRLIVNVGFMPDGLVAHLDNRAEERQIDLIVPFPAAIAAVQRVWQSVWALRSTPYKARFSEHRVAAHDVSEAFDLIIQLLPHATNLVSFAPFGPKPISAAMCLYATLTDCPVFYAQPKVYRPDYSQGVAMVGTAPKICAYWVKQDGRQLYRLPPHRIALN